MDVPPPSELAQILGLSTDGVAVDLFTRSKEKRDGMDLATPHLFFTDTFTEDERASYIEEFASSYLLSFIRTFAATRPHKRPVSYYDILGLLAEPRQTTSFPRFIRNYPDEALALYLVLEDVLEVHIGAFDDILEATYGPLNIAMTIRRVLSVLLTLCDHLSLLIPFPTLRGGTKRGLRVLTSRLHTDSRVRALFKTRNLLEDLETALAMILQIAVDGDEPRRAHSKLGGRAPWWTCERHRRAGADEDSVGLSFVELKSGEEMMACSRCLAVRYCCKEHQKADWKRHKKFCFEATW